MNCFFRKWIHTAQLGFMAAVLAGCVYAGEVLAAGESPAAWPASHDGLLFCLVTTDFRTPVYALDKDGKEILAYAFTARDNALCNRNFGLALSGGSFAAERIEEHLLAELKKSSQLTLEAYITPPEKNPAGPGWIIWFGADTKSPNFALQQTSDKLMCHLRTSNVNPPSGDAPIEITALKSSQPFQLAVTYASGTLVCYMNGAEVLKKTGLKGDFSNWESAHLVFGDEWVPKHNWPGALEGVALYSRAFTPDGIKADYATYNQKLQSRKPPVVLRVQAKLRAKTRTPREDEMGPYMRCLIVYEYAVEKVLAGEFKGMMIRVAHYGVMHRKPVPAIDQRAIGDSVALKLERFDDNPQLQMEMIVDGLSVSTEAMYFDVEP
jgi:hypothetical protein